MGTVSRFDKYDDQQDPRITAALARDSGGFYDKKRLRITPRGEKVAIVGVGLGLLASVAAMKPALGFVLKHVPGSENNSYQEYSKSQLSRRPFVRASIAPDTGPDKLVAQYDPNEDPQGRSDLISYIADQAMIHGEVQPGGVNVPIAPDEPMPKDVTVHYPKTK